MGKGRSVEDFDIDFKVRGVRVKCRTEYPFDSVSSFGFSNPEGLAAIGVFSQCVIDRHESRSSVVVKDAPFYAPGNPGAEHPYKCGLYDVLPIEEIIVICFVQSGEEPAA